MVKEIEDHTKGGHWEVVPRKSVPKGHKAMQGVWLMKRKPGKGFKVYADADFAGGFNKHSAEDPATAELRTAYHIMFNNCLIYSHSKMQMEIALSTMDAEYICLFQALQTVFVLIRFFKRTCKKGQIFQLYQTDLQM